MGGNGIRVTETCPHHNTRKLHCYCRARPRLGGLLTVQRSSQNAIETPTRADRIDSILRPRIIIVTTDYWTYPKRVETFPRLSNGVNAVQNRLLNDIFQWFQVSMRFFFFSFPFKLPSSAMGEAQKSRVISYGIPVLVRLLSLYFPYFGKIYGSNALICELRWE